ncbi:hypothetical protein T265_03686 [Opisthorchis viverrini]|uniref:Uncharacterized protein n=1 Tax=Opisthorchis viverrini TaxID=6198 RepID=A0A074ZVA0_OPIVI|nr:hypothetical protein T265_03686 [Opisthorchis viverrini]KER29777.1 hypothetical protein T265_03686 [Opisthorchis viverrini]
MAEDNERAYATVVQVYSPLQLVKPTGVTHMKGDVVTKPEYESRHAEWFHQKEKQANFRTSSHHSLPTALRRIMAWAVSIRKAYTKTKRSSEDSPLGARKTDTAILEGQQNRFPLGNSSADPKLMVHSMVVMVPWTLESR